MPVPLIGPEIQVNTSTAGAQLFPTVAATADGRFAIAWYEGNGADYRLQTFNADGTKRGGEQLIAVGATNTFDDRIELAGLLNNELAAVFVDLDSNSGDIFYQRYKATAAGYSSPVTRNVSMDGITEEFGLEKSPYAVVYPSGDLSVGYVDDEFDIARSHYDPDDWKGGGGSSSPSELVELEAAAGTTLSKDGEELEADMIVFRNASANTVHIRSTSNIVGNGTDPHIARLTDGGFAVTWHDAGDVLVRIYEANGTTARTAAIPVLDLGFTGSAQPHVCALQDGRFIVVWDNEFAGGGFRANTIYGRMFNPDGTPDSNAFVIDDLVDPNTIATGAPRAAELADGRIVVTYQDGLSSNAEIKAKILDPRLEGVAVAGTRFGDDHVGSMFDDIFVEGAGNDRVMAGNGGDIVDGGLGHDTLFGQAGDDLLRGALGRDLLRGGADNDTLRGGDAVDFLDGGTGADVMEGGDGNDIFIVDNARDIVKELGGQGTDVIRSSVSRALSGPVEQLVLTGAGNINGIGNGLANRLTGNAGNNILDGKFGNDILIGGPGDDTFAFSTALDGLVNFDRIVNFSLADDRIRLDDAVFTALPTGTLAPGAFFIGAAAHDANDRIIYNSASGVLIYDENGNAAGGAVRFAAVGPGLALTHDDFFVV